MRTKIKSIIVQHQKLLTFAGLLTLASCNVTTHIPGPNPGPSSSPLVVYVEVTDPTTQEVTRHTTDVNISVNENPGTQVVVVAEAQNAGIASLIIQGPMGGFTCQDNASGVQSIGDQFSEPLETAFPDNTTKVWRDTLTATRTTCGANSSLIHAEVSYRYTVTSFAGKKQIISVSFSERGTTPPVLFVEVIQPEKQLVSRHNTDVNINIDENPDVEVAMIAEDPDDGLSTIHMGEAFSGHTCRDDAKQEMFAVSGIVATPTSVTIPNDQAFEIWQQTIPFLLGGCPEGTTLIESHYTARFTVVNTQGQEREISVTFYLGEAPAGSSDNQ